MGDTHQVRRTLLPRVLGALSGMLLVAGHLYWPAIVLQTVALAPILYVLGSSKVPKRLAVTAGVYMGIFYTLPMLLVMQMPPLITVVLLVDLTGLLVLFAAGAIVLLRKWPLVGAVGTGGLLAGLDWLNFTLVPIWGVAQSLARPWACYPTLVGFVSITGLTGVLFVLGCLQALAVRAVTDPTRRVRAGVVAAALLAAVVVANIATRTGEPTGTITVAAVGWTTDDADKAKEADGADKDGISDGFRTLFARPVAEAASRGARLVVSPELGFHFYGGSRDRWLDRFRKVARDNGVYLAFGYYDIIDNANRLAFMGPDGTVLETYTKTYLTPFEATRPGMGDPAVTNILGHPVGGMICNDDNYTSFTREYGRRGVALMAVPTLDWLAVKDAHFESSVGRAIESRYAIVRAARNGISAIVSPYGDVLARRDHFVDGSGMVLAEVQLRPQRTLFSIAGHWPAMLGAAFAAGCFAVIIAGAIRSKRRPPNDTPA